MKEKTIEWDTIKGELLRKSIHMLISFVPFLAKIHILFTLYLLAAGILFFTLHEYLRLSGVDTRSLITRITILASRERDKGHIVLGPITLGLGALLALLFYPDPAASIAVYALAFGDGLASLTGKILGRNHFKFIPDKTLEGSFSCFISVFIASLVVTRGLWWESLLIAFGTTLLEVLPFKDIDNIIIPLGAGFIAVFLGI